VKRDVRGGWAGGWAALALALAGAGLTPPALADEDKVLRIYNWSDYIADDTLANFEKETGIKVRYDSFTSNELVHAKLVAGKSGYDLVVPSSSWAKLQADGGALRPLDKALLPNLKNLDPAIQARLAHLDPGNQYMVNWLWGFTTVGVNTEKVKAALGGLPWPDNAWDLLFKPEYAARLKSCGVSFLDSGSEVVPLALHYLGKKPYSLNPGDYAQATQLLKQIRPFVSVFSSTGYINDLASGSVCVAMGWSGDINIARQRALQGRTGHQIETLLPQTGGLLFFDVMVIPADAERPQNAHRFINYILRPEVHASLTNKVFSANPNQASRPFIRTEVVNNPTVFLSDAEMQKMVFPEAVNNDIRRLVQRTFVAFKSDL
jgi:putrescine transport system substrate-binding protein